LMVSTCDGRRLRAGLAASGTQAPASPDDPLLFVCSPPGLPEWHSAPLPSNNEPTVATISRPRLTATDPTATAVAGLGLRDWDNTARRPRPRALLLVAPSRMFARPAAPSGHASNPCTTSGQAPRYLAWLSGPGHWPTTTPGRDLARLGTPHPAGGHERPTAVQAACCGVRNRWQTPASPQDHRAKLGQRHQPGITPPHRMAADAPPPRGAARNPRPTPHSLRDRTSSTSHPAGLDELPSGRPLPDPSNRLEPARDQHPNDHRPVVRLPPTRRSRQDSPDEDRPWSPSAGLTRAWWPAGATSTDPSRMTRRQAP